MLITHTEKLMVNSVKKYGNKGSICHLMSMSTGLDDTLVTHSGPLRSPDLSSKTVNACSFILSSF